MTQRIIITVTEHGVGYLGEIPDGLEVEVRDYRVDSIQSHLQQGIFPNRDETSQAYISTLLPFNLRES